MSMRKIHKQNTSKSFQCNTSVYYVILIVCFTQTFRLIDPHKLRSTLQKSTLSFTNVQTFFHSFLISLVKSNLVLIQHSSEFKGQLLISFI